MDTLFSIICTTCDARLVVREAAAVGRILACPKCGGMIQVEPPPGWEPPLEATGASLSSDGDPSSAESVPVSSQGSSAGDDAERFDRGWASSTERRWQRLVIAGTVLASAVLLALSAWRYLGGRSQPPGEINIATQEPQRTEGSRPPETSTSRSRDVAESTGETDTSAGQLDDPSAVATVQRPGEENHRSLLRGLGIYEGSEGAYPAGAAGPPELVPTARLSWLASLLDYYGHSDWRQELEFDQRWNHPRNGIVARRRLEPVMNPSLEVTTNEEGYALTHFVGLAGWGEGAAELKAGHPRAGVFGYDRHLTLDRAVDGSSNTIAIMGVTGRLGPWAQGGPSTVRALTREPYVNGPDGFGTGQADGTLVGMLDGSVRFISKDVDPRVLKQLATLGGDRGVGVAASEPVPSESRPMDDVPPRTSAEASPPSDDETAATAVAEENKPAAEGETALEPIVEAPPRTAMPAPIDIAARLADRLAEIDFDAVPLTDFLEFISQMTTIPITLDVDRLKSMGLALNSAVSVKMLDAPVGEILGEALSAHGLTYEIVEGHLRVSVPREKRDALSTIRYRVDDLAAGGDDEMETFATLVRRLVAPTSWGEKPAAAQIQIDGDSLVVRQTAAVHDRLLFFCEKLRLARGRPLRGGRRSESIRLETRHARAGELLDTPLEATFFEPTRLEQIVSYLEHSAEVEILVDWLSLWYEGVYHDAKATLRCDGCPLQQALEALSEPLELTYRVVDERTLEITTRRTDARRPVLEVYSIAELLAQGEAAETVIARLVQILAGGWSEPGAAAAIEFDAASRSLLVLDSHRAQRRIDRLLADWQAPETVGRPASKP